MEKFSPIAIVTILSLIQAFFFAIQVGRARMKYGVMAPLTSGNEDFERHYRVHQNTIEQLIIFIPALWIFGFFMDVYVGSGVGILFLVGRILYRSAYLKDPKTRSLGFGLGALAIAILSIGAVSGFWARRFSYCHFIYWWFVWRAYCLVVKCVIISYK